MPGENAERGMNWHAETLSVIINEHLIVSLKYEHEHGKRD